MAIPCILLIFQKALGEQGHLRAEPAGMWLTALFFCSLPCVERPHIAWMSSVQCSDHQLSQRNGEEDPSVNLSTYIGSPLRGKKAFSSCWHAQLGCKWIFLFVKYQARVVAQFFLFWSDSVLPNYVQLLEVRMNHQHCETKWLSFLSEFSDMEAQHGSSRMFGFGSFSFQILFCCWLLWGIEGLVFLKLPRSHCWLTNHWHCFLYWRKREEYLFPHGEFSNWSRPGLKQSLHNILFLFYFIFTDIVFLIFI